MQKLPSVIEMTKYQRQLRVPPDDVDAVHEFLEIIWTDNAHIPPQVRMSFETALIELAANIISYSLATSGVICEISIETSDERIDATISDNGELIELELDSHIMPDALSESGRGIPLIKALVDDFTFDTFENRNIWRLTKGFAT